MKTISITNRIYNQLKAMADEQEADIDVVACLNLERSMSETNRLHDNIDSLKAKTEFYECGIEMYATYQDALAMAKKSNNAITVLGYNTMINDPKKSKLGT